MGPGVKIAGESGYERAEVKRAAGRRGEATDVTPVLWPTL